MKIDKYKEYWLRWLISEKRLSKNTYSSYLLDFESFVSFMNEYYNRELDIFLLKEVDEKSIRAWFFSKIKKGNGARSNARSLSSIKSFFLYLIKNKIIENSSILSMKSPKFIQSIPRPLSINQLEKMIQVLKKNKNEWIAKRNISIIFLMWGLGLRINEVLNLKISDIQNKESILVKGKGGSERVIPIFEELGLFLNNMIKAIPINIKVEDYIFIGVKGKKLHPAVFQKEIKELRNLLNLPDNTTPHSLRHSFASQLLDNMVDLRSIQELMGHKSLSSTQKYTAIDSKRTKKIIEIYHPRSTKEL